MSGLVKVCCYCGQFTNSDGTTRPLSDAERAATALHTHGICPQCFVPRFGALDDTQVSDIAIELSGLDSKDKG
jgi:hypothetical protein